VVSNTHNKKRPDKVNANLKQRDNSANLSAEDSFDDDLEEARKTLEIGKQLGLYKEIEDKTIQNITKLRRSSRKRSTPRCFK
jgi:hypothetical protein